MAKSSVVALGLDFGTESVRALLVDLDGVERAPAVSRYKHGQILDKLPTGEKLPPSSALQHPRDWIDSSAEATKAAMRRAGVAPSEVVGVGVDFTSCTMLPTLRDGTPLCEVKPFAREPQAWPKLWKHHGAHEETERFNEVARRRKEAFLDDYGGTIGIEWFFPKVFEALAKAPRVYEAAEVWLEAGDWFVWQLVGGPAEELPRSTCQAGYKALWSSERGYPSTAFFKAVDSGLANVVGEKMPGRLLAPGEPAGELSAASAKRLGLAPGIPVSAAVIDAHAGVPGAGAAEPGTLVMVLGTSSCHMLNATEYRFVPGVAGVVRGGILPQLYGYETGQAAVGDAFDWLRRLTGHGDFEKLNVLARDVAPGSEGALFLDWVNGCRTPLMDGELRGAFAGLTLAHRPEHLYRAALEGTAFGTRWIVELLREHGVPVEKFVATGGLPHHNPLIVEIYADVLGEPVSVHPCQNGPALGAAILGALAAGKRAGFRSPTSAVKAMAAPKRGVKGREPHVIRPNRANRKGYDAAYAKYRSLAAASGEKMW